MQVENNEGRGLTRTRLQTLVQNKGRSRTSFCKHNFKKVKEKVLSRSWKYQPLNKVHVLIITLNCLLSSFGLNPEKAKGPPWRNRSKATGVWWYWTVFVPTLKASKMIKKWWRVLEGCLWGRTTGCSPPECRNKGTVRVPFERLQSVSLPYKTIEESLPTQICCQGRTLLMISSLILGEIFS